MSSPEVLPTPAERPDQTSQHTPPSNTNRDDAVRVTADWKSPGLSAGRLLSDPDAAVATEIITR